MNKRLDYIDRAKGFLIILVVIGHIWQSGPVFDVIYAFHMPAFFVISGILMTITRSYEKKFGRFFLSRLLAFGIPFIWIEFLGCLTDIVRHGVTLKIQGYIFNTIILDYNDPNLWFIVDLFLIELLSYWLIRLLKKKQLLLAASIVLFAASFFIPKPNSYISTISGVLYYNLFFACGFCGAEFFKKTNIPVLVGSVIAVFAAGLLLKRGNSHSVSPEALAFLISGLCGAYAVIQLGKVSFPGIIDRVLIKCGMNTIIIYGTHHFYYAVIGALLGITDYNATPIVPGLIMLLGVALLEIPTIYLINRWAPWLTGRIRRKTEPKKPDGITK